MASPSERSVWSARVTRSPFSYTDCRNRLAVGRCPRPVDLVSLAEVGKEDPTQAHSDIGLPLIAKAPSARNAASGADLLGQHLPQ
jgi:hypothetical protein